MLAAGEKVGLVVVDVQNYYLRPASDFQRFHEERYPGSLRYIGDRCRELVLPNIARLLRAFRQARRPIYFLRLCGLRLDRGDLHPLFREAHTAAALKGFPDLYPLSSSPMADVVDEIRPLAGEAVLDKTTFSGFNSGRFEPTLKVAGLDTLIFTGLATSQCVDTTARDASDRGYRIIHIPDAQADYSAEMHHAALYASQGVCGGIFFDTLDFIHNQLPA